MLLKNFWERYPDARYPLEAWHDTESKVIWSSPHDIKSIFANASICANNRVVFTIGGNKYHLVVEIAYQASAIWVKFISTHMEYDKINVETINEY